MSLGARDSKKSRTTSDLLAKYSPVPGVPDELIDANGAVRPVWQSFVDHLSGLSAKEIAMRFARGNRYLSDAGVFYRKYEAGGSSERDWPLSHLPVLIDEQDWTSIASGLIQRADLLETVANDLYGANSLVSGGHLPASLIAQNPKWLRPLVGVKPTSGHFLNFIAFEIGRGPDGQWWVLGDRTECPSGAGFALENRVATTRVFPNFYAKSQVHRLAGFFRAYQSALYAQRPNPESQIAILTPGPMNDGYFEHTYIARYLGFLLAEGEDLTVQGRQVMVRTVSGLRPVSVLWRRQDAAFCDPLELDENSQLGTPGLVDAIRGGGLSMVNALGTAVLETRALMAFLPQISQALTGTSLSLPNIATWWCGQEAERKHVLANLEKMLVGSAFATRAPFDSEDGGVLNGIGTDRLDASNTSKLIDRNGPELVGQEAISLSTTPVWNAQGALEPRPMTLRVFLARTESGWQVMPGGYARIGGGRETKALAMQKGGAVADVWVVSKEPVAKPSLIAGKAATRGAQTEAALPSRAADNLFWLGRYVERSENNMRLFRGYFARRAEGVDEASPLLTHVRKALLLRSVASPNGLSTSFEGPLDDALEAARRVRDRFSVDGMMALADLSRNAKELRHRTIPTDEIPDKVSILLRKITGFAGLVHENMYRSTGWRFLSLGSSLERAANMATLLSALAREDAPEGSFELLLELGDSAMTHRMRYSVGVTQESAIELLALDAANPRSILYHLSRARDHINALPGNSDFGRMSPASRLALQLETRLAVETTNSLTPDFLLELRADIWRLSDLLAAQYLK